MRDFRFATFEKITLKDLEETFTYFTKEDMDEMNDKMHDILDGLYGNCSHKERLVFEGIFRKAYVSAFIQVKREKK